MFLSKHQNGNSQVVSVYYENKYVILIYIFDYETACIIICHDDISTFITSSWCSRIFSIILSFHPIRVCKNQRDIRISIVQINSFFISKFNIMKSIQNHKVKDGIQCIGCVRFLIHIEIYIWFSDNRVIRIASNTPWGKITLEISPFTFICVSSHFSVHCIYTHSYPCAHTSSLLGSISFENR